MLDQYNRETSQIHAPAALIQKTKEAMRAEEERLQAEETSRGDSYAIGNSSAHRYAAGISKDCEVISAKKRSIFSYGRLRKWALPLTAAAALVILVSVSAAMRVVKSGGASSDMAADMTEADAGASADEALPAEEMADASVEAPAEEMPDVSVEAEVSAEEMADASAEAGAPVEEMPDVSVEAGAPAEEMLDASAETASGGITEASESDAMAASEKAESKDNFAITKNEGAAQASEDTLIEESKMENSVVKPDEELTITEVEKKPSVYNSSEAERISYQEVIFYVVSEEDGAYSAYARVNRSRYVISGKAADREEFLEKAYELLEEESFY